MHPLSPYGWHLWWQHVFFTFIWTVVCLWRSSPLADCRSTQPSSFRQLLKPNYLKLHTVNVNTLTSFRLRRNAPLIHLRHNGATCIQLRFFIFDYNYFIVDIVNRFIAVLSNFIQYKCIINTKQYNNIPSFAFSSVTSFATFWGGGSSPKGGDICPRTTRTFHSACGARDMQMSDGKRRL